MSHRARPALPRLAVAAMACGALLAACAQGREADPRPNVVLITVDTLRADHLSIYGFRKRRTPHIDALAQRGVVFDRAYCDVTWTTSSMASTWTGQFPLRHGVRTGLDRLADDKVTVAEMLGTEGYRTGAVVGSYPLDSVFQLDQGFDVYDDDFTLPRGAGPKPGPTSRRTDEEVTRAAIRLLETFAGAADPFLLWVHYFGPHSIIDVRLEYLHNIAKHVRSYPDKVVRTDGAVGRLLGALERLDFSENTLVILHSDHGESLGEHGYVGHGRYLYEDNLRIPLVMSWPRRLPAGSRVDALVGNVDLAPTILEAAGVRRADLNMDGRSLLGVTTSGSPVREELYCETYLSAYKDFAERVRLPNGEQAPVGVRRHGLLRPPWKYIVTEPHPLLDGAEQEVPDELRAEQNRRELYHLTTDMSEEANLMGSAGSPAGAMAAALSEYRATASDSDETPRIESSPEHIEKLRALGYVE